MARRGQRTVPDCHGTADRTMSKNLEAEHLAAFEPASL
jgi:hypothetical protein